MLIASKSEQLRMKSLSEDDKKYMQPYYGWLSPEGEYHELEIIHTHDRYLNDELGMTITEAEEDGWVHLSRSIYYHAASGDWAKSENRDKRLTSQQIRWLRKNGYEICRVNPTYGKIAA